jgi:CheY-like chemotaxis protein
MNPIKILYVEDSEGDILLFENAIDDSGIDYTLDVARNGNEAISFLHKEKNYCDKKTPDIILLDINMPEMNGFELLDIVKADENLKQLPVFMFTTSSSQQDILIAYKKYANSYFIKPTLENEFEKLIKGIEYYWFNLAKLPTQLN